MIAEAVAAASLSVHRAEPMGARLLVARGGAVVSLDPQGRGPRRVVTRGADAAWSPDGTLIAFARRNDLWVENSDGSGQRQLTRTPRVVESDPGWSADGRSLVYATFAGGRLGLRRLTLPFGGSRRIATRAASWSPALSRSRLAFVSDPGGVVRIYVARPDGSHAVPFHGADPSPPGDIRDLAWSPDGRRLAYVEELVDGSTRVVVDNGATRTVLPTKPSLVVAHPVWSPDGRRLAFEGAGTLRIASASGARSVVRGRGTPLDWQRVPLGQPRFPDLVQRPPSGLTITQQDGSFLLGFTSLVDNRGPGVLWIHASRPATSLRMTAVQRIALAGGGFRTVAGVGYLRYTNAPPHHHWHLLGYDRYELRNATDFRLVVRDHKSGFCLADHYGIALGMSHGAPRFLSSCGQFEPWLRSVDEGTSVGYTDRYPANFHGQNLNLTGVPAGRYWLVHRTNSNLGLRERNYDNDAASLLVDITWPHGHTRAPLVKRLRACLAERC